MNIVVITLRIILRKLAPTICVVYLESPTKIILNWYKLVILGLNTIIEHSYLIRIKLWTYMTRKT